MSGHLKNILTLVLAAVVVAPLMLLLSLHARSAADGVRARLAQKAAYAPKLKEARRLGLTYEAAVAAPAAALGKPAVWCLYRRGDARALYQGDEHKPLYISNPGRMSQPLGSHQSCQDALIEFSTFTVYSFGGPPVVRLEASFIAYP